MKKLKVKSSKSLTLVLFTLGTASATPGAFAQGFSYFENVREEFCPEKKIDYRNDAVFCKASDFQLVKNAKVGAAVTDAENQKIGFFTYSAVDAGMVPDDSSHTAYRYKRWLVNPVGQKVGIVTIEGWTNSESESSARFDVRYNLKGEVVMATTKAF